VITYDFDHYDADNKEDVDAWVRILKTYGAHLELSSDTLLLYTFQDLIYVTNGVVGLLDKCCGRPALSRARSEPA
jgi:hypothetical protein